MVTSRRRRRPTTDPTTAVAYLRLSKDDDEAVKKGRRATGQVGLDVQRARIESWAAREGVTIAAWHVEEKGVSGTLPIDQRPAFVAALGALETHRAGLFVVYDRSRLARDVRVAAVAEGTIGQLGARVVTSDGNNGDSPEDEAMRQVQDVFHQLEVAKTKARTKAALAAKAARGERTGTVPYGYRVGADNVHLEPDSHEQAVIAAARDLRASGMTLQAITEELECRGLVNRKGKPFSLPAIHAMTGGAS